MNSILDRIKDWSIEKFATDEVLVMLLIGSSVKKKEYLNVNDVDILIILENSDENFTKVDDVYENIKIDMVKTGENYLRQLFNKDAENIFDLNLISAFCMPLQDGVVWYRKYNEKIDLLEISKKWNWLPKYKIFFEFDLIEPKTLALRNAYFDHLRALEVLKSRLSSNLAISYRRKDLPELSSISTEEVVLTAKERIIPLYHQLSLEEEWEFVPYVQKAIDKKEWGKALDNLKDILQGLVFMSIPHQSKNYFNPSIWTMAEENGLSKELNAAIESIF
jgi:hypothetical protein